MPAINTSTSVDHDCTLGDCVFVSPGVRLGGQVRVGDLSFVGTGASIIPGRTIGRNVVVGAGAVVITDVPDDADGPVALGGRRLKIIDLNPKGHRPMANEDATAWIVYNGEVYNFREVRAVLATRGHRFRSKTKSEVVLKAYEEWGEVFLERLNGMFALAIWDARAEQLLHLRARGRARHDLRGGP